MVEAHACVECGPLWATPKGDHEPTETVGEGVIAPGRERVLG